MRHNVVYDVFSYRREYSGAHIAKHLHENHLTALVSELFGYLKAGKACSNDGGLSCEFYLAEYYILGKICLFYAGYGRIYGFCSRGDEYADRVIALYLFRRSLSVERDINARLFYQFFHCLNVFRYDIFALCLVSDIKRSAELSALFHKCNIEASLR